MRNPMETQKSMGSPPYEWPWRCCANTLCSWAGAETWKEQDESTAPRQLKLPGHYLVDPYTWPHIWPWKFKYQGHGQGQTHCHIWGLEFKSICLLFVSWQLDHIWLRYSKFNIWPWKFKVKVTAKVKSDGHIWGIEFNQYINFSFRGNRTIFGRYSIANSIFNLENSRSR